MDANWDKFIIASFALWAGDFDYFEALLKEFSPQAKSPRFGGPIGSSDEVVRSIGALRVRQYQQKKREFKKWLKGQKNLELSAQPYSLSTEHLRATVRRVGAREFVMYAYLTHLAFADELFERSRLIAQAESFDRVSLAEPEGQPRLKQYVAPGSAWTVVGNPFIQVELTDMGLLEANALWTERVFPNSGAQITNAFLGVLTTLEQSSSVNESVSNLKRRE